MRNLIISSIALTIILGLFQWMFFSDLDAPNTASSAWGTNLDDAMAEGIRTNRPVLILWTRDDSAVSARFESETLDSPTAQMAVAPFIVVRIDAAAHPELKSRMGATGTPYVVVFRDGRKVDAFTPAPDPNGFSAQVSQAYARQPGRK